MANVFSSISSFWGGRSTTNDRKESSLRDLGVAGSSSSTVSSLPPVSRGSTPFDPRTASMSFEDVNFTTGNGAAYPPKASDSYTTPVQQQHGFDHSLVSPGSQYPPEQSPYRSPASTSRQRLNGPVPFGSPAAPVTSYPSVRHTFNRIATVLGPLFPELLDTLGNPVQMDDVNALNDTFARVYSLPRDVRESMACHDGQDIYSLAASGSYRERRQRGLVWGLWLMTTDEIADDYRHWRKLERKEMRGELPVDDPFAPAGKPLSVPGMTSCPAGWVREEYSHPGWVPLLTDGHGNYVGIDLDPPATTLTGPHASTSKDASAWQSLAGRPGQIIAFGREIDCKTVLFPGWGPDGGWARFLSSFADDLESGDFGRLGNASDEDLSSADGLGERDYFDEGADRFETSFAGSGNGGGGGRRERHRDRPPSGGSWRLHADYADLGIIEALCLRSRRRWNEVGLGASDDVAAGNASGVTALERSESMRTVRPSSPNLMVIDTTRPAAVAADVSESAAPETPTQATKSAGRPDSPQVTLSPPTPNRAHHEFDTLSDKPRPRRPPPPVASLGLPTLNDIDAFAADDLPAPVSTTSTPRSSFDRRRQNAPDVLPVSVNSPTSRPQGLRQGSFGIEMTDAQQPNPAIEIVVQRSEKQQQSRAISPLASEKSFGDLALGS